MMKPESVCLSFRRIVMTEDVLAMSSPPEVPSQTSLIHALQGMKNYRFVPRIALQNRSSFSMMDCPVAFRNRIRPYSSSDRVGCFVIRGLGDEEI